MSTAAALEAALDHSSCSSAESGDFIDVDGDADGPFEAAEAPHQLQQLQQQQQQHHRDRATVFGKAKLGRHWKGTPYPFSTK